MSDNTFTLRIELGSDAMQNADDVAAALEKTAHTLRRGRVNECPIRDTNGNTVGQWQFTTELTK